MQDAAVRVYRCPATLEPLTVTVENRDAHDILTGALENACRGTTFPIVDGIPDFTWPIELAEADRETRDAYEGLADEYDKYAPLPFRTYRADEGEVRERMVDQLALEPGSRVLEIGCGSGRGSEYIARRLRESGLLYLQEISPKLLRKAIAKLTTAAVPIEYSIANGSYLPFADDFFDAAHHFGGINTFADIPRCLREMARVVRPGGKVMVGDESLAPWLRDSEFGKVMANSNPLLKCPVPLDAIPENAREVRIEWILSGAFYSMEFCVGEGPPVANYHTMIPSARGGSHWTRYYGQLEGVTDEAKELAEQARRLSGKSMHEWLDEIVKRGAQRQIDSG